MMMIFENLAVLFTNTPFKHKSLFIKKNHIINILRNCQEYLVIYTNNRHHTISMQHTRMEK